MDFKVCFIDGDKGGTVGIFKVNNIQNCMPADPIE